LNDLFDGAGKVIIQSAYPLGQIPDSVPLMKRSQRLTKNIDGSLLRSQNAQNIFNKSAFAGSIGSGNAQIIAFFYGKRNIADDFQTIVAEG
jgi:hypothetical protein